ncbi:MAG TPA: histone deacetylase [Ktedonobacteraceae bacterium]
MKQSHRSPFLSGSGRLLRKMLYWYWRFFLYILVAAFGAFGSTIFQWLQSQTNTHPFRWADLLPGLLHTGLVQLFFATLPWPITALFLLFFGTLAAIAWRVSHNRAYYTLLERSEQNYYQRIYRDFGFSDVQVEAGNGVLLTSFDTDMYVERESASLIFAEFLSQQKKRIFLLVGAGGTGKSVFLRRRMGELSGILSQKSSRCPCVFIDCKLQRISGEYSIKSIIEDQLNCHLDELHTLIHRLAHHPLVVFIDAINENTAQEDINAQLTHFANRYLNGNLPMYLCISVRKTYWEEQNRRYSSASEAAGWLNSIYRPEGQSGPLHNAEVGLGGTSVILQDFNNIEFKEAYTRYARACGIKGHIDDPQTYKICRNPLMLRVLSLTFRGQNIAGRVLLRDVDIFDEYARITLKRTIEKIGSVDEKPILYGETLQQRVTRGLVLTLALEMVKRGRPFLSDDEIFETMRRDVPDALEVGHPVKSISDLYARGSVLKAVLEEGDRIVLETGQATIPRKGLCSGIRFVHERYFEYSIGRAIVRQWHQRSLNAQEMLKDFVQWMRKHDDLAIKSFPNLRQGLGIAVLIAEQDPLLPPGIQYNLLQILARDEQFSWNQLACRRMLQIKELNDPLPCGTGDRSQNIERLLDLIEAMSRKDDFVLRWDIERVLLRLTDIGAGQAVLRRLSSWGRPDAPFAQQLFSAECLGYLFRQSGAEDYRARVLSTLQDIVESAPSNFWIRRSLHFSISAMIDALDASTSSEYASSAIRRDILQIVEELGKSGQSQWDRSLSICIQMARDIAGRRFERWLQWDWAAEKPWTCTNAVLALEQVAASGSCPLELVELLHRIWEAQRYTPHLNWALAQILQQVLACSTRAAAVAEQAEKILNAIQEYSQVHTQRDERAAWVGEALEAPSIPEMHTPIAIVYHPEYAHSDLHNHPESKERVEAIVDYLDGLKIPPGLRRADLFRYISPYAFPDWNDETFLGLAHQPEWIDRVRDLSAQLKRTREPDKVVEKDMEVRAGSYEGACLAARGAVCGVELVLRQREVRLAIALIRPPGHLAGNKICIFNNIAIAAKYALQQKTQKILIVDCDAHHGQSTQNIFYYDDAVIYFSIHQAGIHPGTGRFEETGEGSGSAHTINVPVPPHSGDYVYQEVLKRLLEPLLNDFQPQLILLSLGLDAYYRDTFSQLELSEYSFQALAQCLFRYCEENQDVSIVAVLEGGYDLDALGPCILPLLKTFGRWTWLPDHPATARRGVSPLDVYLAECEAGKHPLLASREDKRWLQQLEHLEISLPKPWWKQ